MKIIFPLFNPYLYENEAKLSPISQVLINIQNIFKPNGYKCPISFILVNNSPNQFVFT